jgi:hypothetical protein
MALPDLGLVTVKTPRPASNCWSTPATRAFAKRFAPSPRSARPTCAPRWRRPVDTLELATDDDLLDACCASPTCAASAAARSAAGACRATCARGRKPTKDRKDTAMTFLWPRLLWLLLLLPLLVLLYLWLLRRRKAHPCAGQRVIAKEAMGKGPGWRAMCRRC